jgi:two-component system, NtrC family, nitrogen regulation sensor histidine kinase NtrY
VGLAIIHDRADSLGRFMGAYARLARVPPPVRRPGSFSPLIHRAASLYGERVVVEAGPEVTLTVDRDQIEQVLINLIQNAVEAVETMKVAEGVERIERVQRVEGAESTGLSACAREGAGTGRGARTGGSAGKVRVRWRAANGNLLAEIEDDGPGLARTESLWVPFFTTKPGGSGIGLALSREIVENHGGAISLHNRVGAPGCLARIVLPL